MSLVIFDKTTPVRLEIGQPKIEVKSKIQVFNLPTLIVSIHLN